MEGGRLGLMPQDESGPQRQLSRPWHGPYRIISITNPDELLTKVYFPQDRDIQVHQGCPPNFPATFYWYGGRRHGPGRPPRWVSELLDAPLTSAGADSIDVATDGETTTPEPAKSSDTSTNDCTVTANTSPTFGMNLVTGGNDVTGTVMICMYVCMYVCCHSLTLYICMYAHA